jgi:predicted ester cyclase
MSTEDNKALVRKMIDEVFVKQNLDALGDYMAADMVDHNPPPMGKPGLEGLKEAIGMFISAFPDLHIQVDDIIAEGDLVVMRGTSTGTHQGDFMGIAATGNKISYGEIHIVRIAGGKMVEHWGVEDQMTMMQQLGVVPS